MDFVPIFESEFCREDCCIWSVDFENGDDSIDEFWRLLDLWGNIEYLRGFFKSNEYVLKTDFWQKMSVNDAIAKVYREVALLQDRLLDIEIGLHENDYAFFHEIFYPLHDKSFRQKTPLALKGKPNTSKPFIRFYGLKLDECQIVITGGGIKLTKTMQECPFLTKELHKIDTVRNYLRENGIVLLYE